MKKISLLISAAIFAVAGFFFAGCEEGDDVTEVLAGPTNTWCSMPVNYQYQSSSDSTTTTTTTTTTSSDPNIYVYFYYTATDVTSSSEGASVLKNGTTIPAGLTMVVTSVGGDSSSVITGLTKNAYIMKNFPLNSTINADEDDTSDTAYKMTGSREKWSMIYWSKKELRQADNQSTTPPAQLTNGGEGTELSWESVKSTFSWKQLLINYLLSD